jgi:hypothetical protein
LDIQNHFYGHSAALALAAGVRRPRHIPGLLQHGWTVLSPALVQAHDFPQVGVDPRWTMFVWSHTSRGWSPDDEERRTSAIGSPFLYLEQAARAAGWKPAGTGPTLWIPFHGTRLLRVTGDHAALAREAFDRDGRSTVCLHVEDAGDPEIVEAWRGPGHDVVTAGRRGDPDFLSRILSLIGSARRVASNRLGTATMYAAALGKEVAVYGPPLALSGEEARTLERIRELWPEMHGDTTSVALTAPLADAELGRACLLPPARLRAALGWDRPLSTRAAGYYWTGSSLRKAAAVLGIAGRTGAVAPGAGGVDPASVSPWAFLRHPLSHVPTPLPRRLPRVEELAAPLPVARA